MSISTKENKNKDRVSEMFDQISEHYDLLNRVLSLRIDRLWRKKVMMIVMKLPHNQFLDVASGTGDMSILATKLNTGLITSVDISPKMLEIQKHRIAQKKLENRIRITLAQAEKLPFPDSTFDVATCAFGVRNFENTMEGLKEIYRVLKEGGTLIVLEFSKPKGLFAPFFTFYFRNIVPFIGRILSNHKHAYQYLPNTVDEFPSGEDFLKLLNEAGFQDVTLKALTFEVATIYSGHKNSL